MTYSTDDLSLLTVYGPVMLRMLQARESRLLNKLYGDFRNGNHNPITQLAEWASVRDQINEINNGLRQAETTKEQLHANSNS